MPSNVVFVRLTIVVLRAGSTCHEWPQTPPHCQEPGERSEPEAAGSSRIEPPKPKIAATIAFLVCYRAGDALMFAMNVPFLEHLGLDTSTRGLVQGTIGTLLSIGGAIVGGLVISLVTTLLSILAGDRPGFAVVRGGPPAQPPAT